MSRDDALTIVGMIVSAWPGADWDADRMDAYAHAIEPWDAVLTTRAVAAAVQAVKFRPSVAELREYVNIERRLSEPDSPRPELPSIEMPRWVKGWFVARFRHDDWRAWPEQHSGFTRLQAENPRDRSYVWTDQEEMPEEERMRYEEEGASVPVSALMRMIGA